VKHLYKVTFDAKYTGIGDLQEETVNVVGNGDGLKAIEKAKRQVVGRKFDDRQPWGAYVTRKCVWVKVIGLEQLHEIDA
jgi:hypothetical protein